MGTKFWRISSWPKDRKNFLSDTSKPLNLKVKLVDITVKNKNFCGTNGTRVNAKWLQQDICNVDDGQTD